MFYNILFNFSSDFDFFIKKMLAQLEIIFQICALIPYFRL